MERRAFRIAYDGRPFRGFQRQPDVPTVEGAILDALRRLDVAPPADTPPGYAAAGRTDAGVSALAQTIALDCPDWLTPHALNGSLPGTVWSWASGLVSPDFHATRDAVSRTYTYFLVAPTASVERAREGAERLSGRNDYHNLTPDDHSTTRDIGLDVGRDGAFLVVRATAGGFPRQLVRRIVTLLERVANGTTAVDTIDRVLAPEPIEGPAGIPPAPAHPLVLTDVTYPGTRVERDAEASTPSVATFSDLDAEYRARARVAGRIADGIGRPDGGPPKSDGERADDRGRGNH